MTTTATSDDPPQMVDRAKTSRRTIRRRRRRWAVLTLLFPAGWIVACDLWRRHDHVATFDLPHVFGYVGTAAASLVFWALLLFLAARRRGFLARVAAGLFLTLYTLSAGVQSGFHHFYNIYVSHDAQIYARSVPQALIGYVPLWDAGVSLRLFGTGILGVAILAVARHVVRPRGWTRRVLTVLLLPVLVGMTQIPASYRMWQSSTPDVIYFHGLVSLAKEQLRLTNLAPEVRVQRRQVERVPKVTAQPARRRNVLFILQESLRYDVSCNFPGENEDCATPFSGRALPKRIPFHQLRANAATTAISISNLWSGVPSTESLETLLSVPLLWDYAHAAGYNGAYWTSQNVMFGSMRLYVQDLPVTHRAYGTNLDPTAHYDAGANDALLSDAVIRAWDTLEEPFFAVVHYSNVHFPYVYDKEHAPVQPDAFDKAPSKNEEFLNYYRNVVYLSDRSVGRLVDHVRGSDSGSRTVILYTSDHGESFREHWQLGHTSSLYDEEIKVPGFLDAPEGVLSPKEEASVRAASTELIWHYDYPPTVLDLLGLWDAPELAPFRARMVGHPITRRERTTAPVVLSNCAWLWDCGFRNWGMMQGRMKIEAREWDNEYHCFDVLADPFERYNLGEDACAPLPDVARQRIGPMPFQEWPRLKHVEWGAPPPVPSAVTSTD
jgi:glucan phosphoethanolaminetransferase (alkaline phosphatase superfamily)